MAIVSRPVQGCAPIRNCSPGQHVQVHEESCSSDRVLEHQKILEDIGMQSLLGVCSRCCMPFCVGLTWTWPLSAAQCSGVQPSASRASTGRPCARPASSAAMSPSMAAACSEPSSGPCKGKGSAAESSPHEKVCTFSRTCIRLRLSSKCKVLPGWACCSMTAPRNSLTWGCLQRSAATWSPCQAACTTLTSQVLRMLHRPQLTLEGGLLAVPCAAKYFNAELEKTVACRTVYRTFKLMSSCGTACIIYT